VLTDTIGDGQTFISFGTATYNEDGHPSNWTDRLPDAPSSKEADGTTEFVWNLGTLPPKTIVTLSYTTQVDEQWSSSYGGGPIFAGDSIHNDVTVTGMTAVSGVVSDSSGTSVTIRTPVISETIVLVND